MISIHSFEHIVQQITDIMDQPVHCCVLALQPIVDDFADLTVWSGVADAAFEHRKLKRDSGGGFPDGQSLGKRLGGKVAERAHPLHCEQSYVIIAASVSRFAPRKCVTVNAQCANETGLPCTA